MKSLAILLLLAVLWGVGLLAFADRVARSTPATEPEIADGVVALTGSSSVRIEAATKLLESGRAKRLLISGVNREVTRKEIREVGRGAARTYECCVDLGFRAADTQGNALETASWARYYHYKTLIVVTADYHMPRSLLELHAAMPGVTLRPYPVATAELDAHGWWSGGGQTRRMTLEYCKYLTILGREAILGIGRKPEEEKSGARAGGLVSEKDSPLLILRSLAFALWLYGLLAIMGVGGLPVLFGPRRWSMVWMRWWAQTVVWGLKVFVGVRFEARGQAHRPPAGALIACKHQCMFDTVAPFIFLDDTCFVLKKELTILPVYGWFAARARMIAVDRSAHSKALRALVHASRDRLAEGRQIVIFPEGTRKAPGAEPDYKPGVAALYRELEVPCTPVATNSGVCWPPHGVVRRPGVIIFEFLPPIPPGLKRATFMAVLEDTIEAGSNRLIAEAV